MRVPLLSNGHSYYMRSSGQAQATPSVSFTSVNNNYISGNNDDSSHSVEDETASADDPQAAVSGALKYSLTHPSAYFDDLDNAWSNHKKLMIGFFSAIAAVLLGIGGLRVYAEHRFSKELEDPDLGEQNHSRSFENSFLDNFLSSESKEGKAKAKKLTEIKEEVLKDLLKKEMTGEHSLDNNQINYVITTFGSAMHELLQGEPEPKDYLDEPNTYRTKFEQHVKGKFTPLVRENLYSKATKGY